jgi:hypothetical protein
MSDIESNMSTSEDQMELLKSLLPLGSRISGLTKCEMDRLIKLRDPNAHWRKWHMTDRQRNFLLHYHVWKNDQNRGQAADIIGRIKARAEKDPFFTEYLNRDWAFVPTEVRLYLLKGGPSPWTD